MLPVGEGDAAEAGAARRHSLGEGDAAVVDDQRHCLVTFPVRESTNFSYGTFLQGRIHVGAIAATVRWRWLLRAKTFLAARIWYMVQPLDLPPSLLLLPLALPLSDL